MTNTKLLDSCLIIGAGIAGLTAAGVLRQHGVAVTLLDKARGVGGRMATRRVQVSPHSDAVAIFDHGAQFFTARSDEFQKSVAHWLDTGAASEWFRGQPGSGSASDSHPRFRGTRGMTSIPKHLAQDLNVHLNEFVIHIGHAANNWIAMTAGGTEYSGCALILTPPVPQSLSLLQAGGVTLERADRTTLEAVAYDPCICVMAVLDDQSQVPPPGALRVDGEVIAWIADNYQKGISEYSGAVTMHAAAEWSRENYNQSDEFLSERLCENARQWLGSTVISTQVRRWRYSKAVVTLPAECVVAKYALPLIFAGDAFTTSGTANVESAALSGLAAARGVLGPHFAL